jgi:tRNA-splicing ligase RtcB
MQLSGRYAYAGREHVIEQVLEILGAKVTFSVHNHHNFAWYENGLWVVRKGATPLTEDFAFIGGSMGDDSYIVRGKTPETMYDALSGEADPNAAATVQSLYGDLYNRVVDLGNIGSAPHGAGRQMSRTQAAGKMRKVWACNTRDCGYIEPAGPGVTAIPTCPDCGNRKFRKIRMRDASTAQIDWGAVRTSLTDRGIVVLGAGADEAPGAYKRLDEVLAHHENIEIVHRLSPIGVVMASPDTHDPYKD